MKKLEDIPKKDFFSAPDGYFDSLPQRVAVRLEKKPKPYATAVRYSLQYALPLVVLAVGLFWFLQSANQNAEKLLADVETTELVSYLAEADVSYEDFMDEVKPDREEATALEQEVFGLQWNDNEVDALLNELDNL